MSVGNLICFDASIKDGVIGIGIYNSSNKAQFIRRHKAKTTCSLQAETIALAYTMEYIAINNIKNPWLFTDNKGLANLGIPKDMIDKYGKARLSWIPREFNKIADYLSKSKNTPESDMRDRENYRNLIVSFSSLKALPFMIRLKILQRAANSDFQNALTGSFLKGGLVRGDVKSIRGLYRKKDKVFLAIYTKLLSTDLPRNKEGVLNTLRHEHNVKTCVNVGQLREFIGKA